MSISDVAEEAAKWDLIINWTEGVFNDSDLYHRDPEIKKPRFIYGGEHGFGAIYNFYS